jgi:hypothetical protein
MEEADLSRQETTDCKEARINNANSFLDLTQLFSLLLIPELLKTEKKLSVQSSETGCKHIICQFLEERENMHPDQCQSTTTLFPRWAIHYSEKGDKITRLRLD